MAEKKKMTEGASNAAKSRKVRKPNKTVIFVVLWIAALLAIGYVSFTVSRNGALAANRTAETALSAIKANDDKKVYELGTDDFKKISTQQEVKTVVNEWNPVLAKATVGNPELVSKQEYVKDKKQLTGLVYKYNIQPGKSKINQKEFFVRVITERTDTGYKINAFNFDLKKKDLSK